MAAYTGVTNPVGLTVQTAVWQRFFNTWVGVYLTKFNFRSNVIPTAL